MSRMLFKSPGVKMVEHINKKKRSRRRPVLIQIETSSNVVGGNNTNIQFVGGYMENDVLLYNNKIWNN